MNHIKKGILPSGRTPLLIAAFRFLSDGSGGHAPDKVKVQGKKAHCTEISEDGGQTGGVQTADNCIFHNARGPLLKELAEIIALKGAKSIRLNAKNNIKTMVKTDPIFSSKPRFPAARGTGPPRRPGGPGA